MQEYALRAISAEGAILDKLARRALDSYGLTDVESLKDPSSSDTVAAKHHDKPLYILNNEQPGKNIRRAGFINHTDQELMLIETLVGRTPPFVFAGDEYSAPRRDY